MYQCYYNEVITVGGRGYTGKRINEAVFDTERDAETYCRNYVGIQKTATGFIECEMNYEEVDV